MSLFKKAGRFFTKSVPKFVTKKVPRIVTQDIPRVVTKDIPRVVTKDVPQTAVKLGSGVVDTGKDVLDTLSHADERETYAPELLRLRKQVDAADSGLSAARERFFEARQSYQLAYKRYQALTEDYAARFADASDLGLKVPPPDSGDWNDPANKAEQRLQQAEGALRFVLGFATFNLSEAAWAAPEAREEVAFLRKRLDELGQARRKFEDATNDINSAMREIAEAIDRLQAQLGEADEEKLAERLSEQHLDRAQDDARLDIARSMLREGASIAQAALVTGLQPEQLEALQP